MGRGLFFGGFWGLLVGGVVLSVASLLGETPGSTPPRTDVVEVPAGSGFDTARDDEPADVEAATEDAPEGATAPMVDAPAAPPAPALSADVTTSADVPVTGDVQELAPPPQTPQSSGVVVQLEAPSTPEVSAEEATSLPGSEQDAEPVPEAQSDEPAPEPQDDALEDAEVAPEVAEAPEAESTEAAETNTAEVSETASDDPTPEAAGPQDEASEATESEPAETGDETSEQPATADESSEAEGAPSAEPEVAERPQASAGGFGDRATNVTTNRLPSIGDQADTESGAPSRALVDNAVTDKWSGLDARPLISIILIDEDASAAALPALQGFKGPLTFALPAGRADAVQAMQAYRAAGHEVALIADIPAGSAPSDVEVAFESYFAAVPLAASVLDGSLNGFGGDRRIVAQVAEILAGSGHGLVTFEQGLNSTAQTARRAGVPTATVFRDLDANGQEARVITRFLDQAAFRAGQEGQVILLARMNAETISALLIWSQQDRASRVNLAPISAILQASADQ